MVFGKEFARFGGIRRAHGWFVKGGAFLGYLELVGLC